MTEIRVSCCSLTESSWTRAQQEQIERHQSWHEGVNETQAEALLCEKESFTYLLRRGERENVYYISFVKEDRSIKHQRFTLEYDRKGWYYKNGQVGSPTDIIDEKLERLIPQMMYCSPGECRIVDRHSNAAS